MHLYSIMSLDWMDGHLEEICQDIRRQYESGAADCALMMMTLVPEGNPPVNKAEKYCEKYDRVQARLAQMGLECGVLVQASIGHGWVLNRMFPYQPYVNLTDGRTESVCCPCDEGFRDYIRSAMRTIAKRKPKLIMVDDDFRLIYRAGMGCACPKHMARFNQLAGTELTREELLAHTKGSSDEDRRITEIFIETQRESLVDAAKAMREGIDSVDPSIPGAFCACGPAAEFAPEIAKILAGEGHPAVVRVNNGWYCQAGTKGFSARMRYAAVQAEVMKGSADVLLAETDTCPQNRYSTGAQQLHAHFTGSILEGMRGAKHWVTRLHGYEPASGQAYRKKLANYAGFYAALADIVPGLKWLGCRIPVSKVPAYGFGTSPAIEEINGWDGCVLERLGLPMYFSSDSGGAVFMDGPADMQMTEDEIRELFRGTLFLAADTAMRLNERGFSEYTGVEVRPWTGRNASGELLDVNGVTCSAQKNVCELIPLTDAVRADSTVYHVPDGESMEVLFPGATVFDNPLGGRTVVFSGTPKTNYNIVEAFSFLNESRKKQLAQLLKEAGQLPVYYPGDAEMYFRAAECPDGSLLCAAFNLGLDWLDGLELCTDRNVRSVSMLMPDGTRRECGFERIDGGIAVDVQVRTLEPVILFLKEND